MAQPVPPARRRTRTGVAALAFFVASALGVAGLTAPVAQAQEAVVIDDPRLDPSLAGVQVSGDGYQRAAAALRAASGRLADAQERLAAATARVTSLTDEQQTLDASIAAASERRDRSAEALAAHQSSLRAVAVATFVQGRDTTADALLGGAERAATLARQDTMVADVSERRVGQVREARASIEEAESSLETDRASLERVLQDLAAATGAADAARVEVDDLRRSTDEARRSVADWRITADVAGSDLPLVALDAYVKAARRMAYERPECGLRWSALAAIGKVESSHGTYGGARLGAGGTTSTPIIGIPLDGTNGTAAIGDTDGGELDGDATTDRAVGPMQFIPSSWRSLGRDGNDDGRADPSNIYDAALAAAGLLCRAVGSGLDTDAGLFRAARSYNNSSTYAALVVRTANAYGAREADLIPPPPTTTTTAPPPTPTDPGASATPPGGGDASAALGGAPGS